MNLIERLVCQAIRLHPPSYLKVDMKEHNLPSSLSELPTITLTRDKFIEFSNAYKLMGEMVARLTGEPNFSTYDLLGLHQMLDKRTEKFRVLQEKSMALEKASGEFDDALSDFKMAYNIAWGTQDQPEAKHDNP